MSWNHRVLANDEGIDIHYEIVEVYYNEEGVPKGHFAVADVSADTIEGLKWTLDKMRECLDKPVLSAENFPEKFKLKQKRNERHAHRFNEPRPKR